MSKQQYMQKVKTLLMTYFPSLFIIQQVGQAGWSPSYCEQCVVTPKEKRYELPNY